MGLVHNATMLLSLMTALTEKAALASRRLFHFWNPGYLSGTPVYRSEWPPGCSPESQIYGGVRHLESFTHYAPASRPDETCRSALSQCD
jgi:hypothetical protein